MNHLSQACCYRVPCLPGSLRSAILAVTISLGLCAWVLNAAADVAVQCEITDVATGQPLAARVYVQGANGRWHFATMPDPQGSVVRYEKRNWVNTNAVEFHTTVSAHPFAVPLPPGKYSLRVERGKEYFPATREIVVGTEPVKLRIPLQRWVNMSARGWYSGETHLHRTPLELKNIILAEDLNVTFPLSCWVTKAYAAPAAADIPARLLQVDNTHVIWPLNTEYEIFTIDGKNHTLGALFILNHKHLFTNGVPSWESIAAQSKAEGALLDMDKLDWAFSFMLPPVTGAQLYELANNHLWRTEYGFTNYITCAPPYLHPPYGGCRGNERDWTLYTWGMYYTLLNAGFRSVPTAGTANGVHPVPAGFSRVYVHLPDGFTYERWLQGFIDGRSFVTTGPMLFAKVNDVDSGQVFRPGESTKYRVSGTILSEHPLSFIEIIHNGVAARTIMPQNKINAEGARETTFRDDLTLDASGWLAVRCWEDRPDGRFRWAHTAPWHIEISGKPLAPRAEEKEFLVHRMRDEINRSRSILKPEALAEYHRALAAYEALQTKDDSAAVRKQVRPPKNDTDLRDWLANMVWYHRFSVDEIRWATGLEHDAIRTAMERFQISDDTRPPRSANANLVVLPYPGGRHPRTGFLDGAINPQRDTKFSVFTPWDDRSYVVVDVPEAIWSNLGLTYLAHEHIDTIWTTRGINMEPLEWRRHADGTLDFERQLPNGIAFGTKVVAGHDAVRMETWLRNGTSQTLTALRLQNCVMLKAAAGFSAQTASNKVLRAPYAACRSEDGRRWIITAWDPLDAVWQNPPVPCFHSNPRFPDCPPGQTVRARGWLSFYEGNDLEAELRRIDATGWKQGGR